tara:strand:+ start:1412 stop:4741 length:3330 start_codon:yes stop_codon:yes gene_type:complete
MAITHFGNKMLRGTKLDRVSDSLGSSADGANTGITLTPIKTNSSTNKIDFKALRDGVNHALSYDLGATLSDTLWTCRFVINFSKLGSSGNGNYMYVGLSDKDSSTAQNGNQDFIGTQIQLDGTSNYFSNDSDGASISGTGSGDNSQSWTPSASTNYYVEIIRSSATAYSITIRTGSHSGTSLGTVSGTCATTTVGLRYFKVLNVINSSGGRDLEGTIDTITIDNGASTYSSADYTVNPNSTTGWSGNYKLGTGAYDFTSGQVDIGKTTQTGDFSVTFWFNADSNSGVQRLWHNNNNSSKLEIQWYNSQVAYTVKDATGNNGSSLNTGTWYHVALTREGSAVKLYIDGVLKSSTTEDEALSNADNATIGGSGSSENYNGKIDDVSNWSRALTATEIGKLVNNNIGGDSGWSKTSSNINIQNSRVDFDITSGGSSTSALSYDIGTANIAGTWVLRGKSVITNYTVGGDGSSCHLFVGFSDKDHTTAFDGSQDSLSFAIGAGTNDDNYYIGSSNDGAMYSGSNHTNAQTTHEPTEETLYWELKRTGTQAATLTLYTDSGYSESPSGYSKSITSFGGTPTNFRYLVFKSRDRSVSGSDCIGYIDDLKFWNDTTTASGDPDYSFTFTSGDAQSVSSLTNKSGLKAHYTMDSTALSSLKNTADWTEDFSETTPTSWTEDSSSGYANNLEPYKGSVNRLWFDLDENTGVGVMGMFDLQNAGLLGSNPSNTKWTFRFKIRWTSINSAAGSIWIGLTDSNTAASNGACRFAGCRIKSTVGIQNGSDNGGQALTDSNRTDGGVATTIAIDTDYYVTVSRHTANKLVTTVRSGSHTGTLLGEVTATTLETATDDLRYWKIMNNRSSTNGGQQKGYLYDLEFFNDSATTTGCKNDFSSTSDLEAMTNLPENTIFLQTDDTPSYWWKQSDNTWKLDGSTEPISTIIDWTGLNTGTNEGDGIYKTTSQSWSNIGRSTKIYKIGGNTKVSLRTTSNHMEFGFLKTSTSNVTCFECNGNAYSSGNAIIHPIASGGYGSGNGGNVMWGGTSSPSSSNVVATSWDASSYTTGTNFTMEIKSNGDIEFAMDGVVKKTWSGIATDNEYYFYVGHYATGSSRGLTLGELT